MTLAAGGVIKDADVQEVLECWAFGSQRRVQALSRAEATPFGAGSDAIGLTHEMGIAKLTWKAPALFELLMRWLRQDERYEHFPANAIQLNKNVTTMEHRDGNNLGPSVIKAIGDFAGGRMLYWENDDGTMPVDKLKLWEEPKVLDVSDFTGVDGRKVHGTEAFTGIRYSLVFYCALQSFVVPWVTKEQLVYWGAVWPTEDPGNFQ